MSSSRPRTGGRVRRRLLLAAAAMSVVMSSVTLAAPTAQAYTDPNDTPLSLVNGWTGAPFGTQFPGVKQLDGGIVTFTGAISGGTTGVAFTLPVNDRPATTVYVPVDMCSATKGRLVIAPSGVVTVQAETLFSNAQCFTSLDGATFALPISNTPLTLQNGWQGAPYGTGAPGMQLATTYPAYGQPAQVSVHFTGAISGGSSAVAFTLPPSYRPSTTEYVPVDMCRATNGRLIVSPSGAVSVQAETSFSDAQCFTSLDGAWFNLVPGPFYTPLTLQNGWTAYGNGTAPPAVDNTGYTFLFTGAMSTSGTNPVAFTLPSGWAPPKYVYVPVDLCSATKGRLVIAPTGVVTVQAEGSFSNAGCFTSLDGVSFSLYVNPPA